MEKKLQRNEQEKMIAGVCAGLADYFEVDVTWIRIAFVVAVLAGFSGLLVYIILWIAVPARPANFTQFKTDYRVYEDKGFSNNPVDPNQPVNPLPPYVETKKNNGRVIVGLILIAFGGFFFLDEFNIIPYWFDFGKLWPLVFIIPGILMIAKAGKKEPWKKADWQNKQDWNAKPEENTTDTDKTII